MVIAPFMFAVSSSEAAAIADKMFSRHSTMTTAAVYVSDGISTIAPAKVKFSPSVCTLEMPNQQIIEVKSNAYRFYDEIFNQVAPVKPQLKVKVPDGAPSVAEFHRDAIAWLVDSKQRTQFFNELKRDPRWSLRASSLYLVDPKKKIRSEVAFDTTFRVTEIKLVVNGKTMSDWKYRYVADKDVPTIPTSAKSVKGLSPRPAMPKTTKSDAVLLAQKVWRSVSRLDRRTVVQTNDDGTFALTLKPGAFSEKGPKGSWSLQGTTLTLVPNSGATKMMTVRNSKFVDEIRSHGLDISPVAWYFLNRKLPFLDMFDQTDSIELEGQGSLAGKPMSILSIKRKTNRTRLYVDPTDGDICMVSSDAVDAKGNVITSSRIKISYQ